MGDGDGGVKVDPQLTSGIGGRPGLPRVLARDRPRRPHPGQVGLIDAVQRPPRRRHARDRAEQRLPVAQHLNAGHRVRAVSDRHRQVREHLPPHMQREPPVSIQ
jgi:hypothetical protein